MSPPDRPSWQAAADSDRGAAELARTKCLAYVGAMSSRSSPDRLEGIEVRHSRSCPHLRSGRCSCSPGYRAVVHSRADQRKIQRTFPTPAAAQLWRQDAKVDLRRGVLRAPRPVTVRDVADQWLADAGAGLVRNRSGDPYKPSALRGYEQALRTHLLPLFIGGARLDDVRRPDLQALADQLRRDGLSPSTVRNALMPVNGHRFLPSGGHRNSPVAAIENSPLVAIEIPQCLRFQVVLGASRRRVSSAI